jgi:DNA-binding beta-propeller fold protein YncE
MMRVLLLLGLLALLCAHARTPYTTWALGPGGYLVMTQDAYTPLAHVALPLLSPEDMAFGPDGALYIADTGNGRVVRLSKDFEITAEFGVGLLRAPSGLFVGPDGTLYVADAGKETVVILDGSGQLVTEFGQPSEPLFGRNRHFRPRKIAVDARENLYVVSEASTDGLVMLNTRGNFIGYFGANRVALSPEMVLRRMFLSRDQQGRFIRVEAASPSNLALDAQGLVYTVTAGVARDRSIRKFNFAGRDLLGEVFGSSTFRDIHVSGGLVVAVDAEGRIYEYDANGALLFTFGAPDSGDQRLGMLSDPTAIARAGDRLYVLDRDKNAVVVYQATEFARTVHEGVRLYIDGFYLEARPHFEAVLAYNGLFTLAYQALADAFYKEGDLLAALAYYRYAEARSGYSETFWELRNAALQRHLGGALLGLVGLGVVLNVLPRLGRRRGWGQGLRAWGRKAGNIRLVDDFLFMFRFIKQPADSFYYLKTGERGSLLFALLLYLWVVVSHILSLYATSFVFSPYASPAWVPVESALLSVLVLILLWNVANYLVATISDGEGSLRDVIVGSAYSLFPHAILALPIALLSNLLTLNETFLYTFSRQLMWAWTAIMLFIMVKEVHNYQVSETVRNLLLTLFTMAMLMLGAYILYVLFSQLYEFVAGVIQEVGLRG